MSNKKIKLEEGTEVYYIVGNTVLSGNVTDVELTNTGFKFAIDSYGACEGNFKIDASMIGISVFLHKEDADRMASNPDYMGGFSASC